ncbi:hypothetical protein BDA99DRAFT_560696 [Phascolomyces articulosus]|uniref:F-box domain-containing protein n=1 Tax=Phascolomyces articulosus TaxID=60185 RepID=A0AAD5JYE2_9FUNG|nr:hypothetical protein BDA99DRAFT_560696 [Phascolomyces articulosus]
MALNHTMGIDPLTILPLEVLGVIFTHVPTLDRMTMATVNKAWRSWIYNSPSAWRITETIQFEPESLVDMEEVAASGYLDVVEELLEEFQATKKTHILCEMEDEFDITIKWNVILNFNKFHILLPHIAEHIEKFGLRLFAHPLSHTPSQKKNYTPPLKVRVRSNI